MRRVLVVLMLLLLVCSRAAAQPSRIGPFAVDVRLVFPRFPDESPQLAFSRGINQADLPGLGRGIDVGGQLYLFKWRAVTFGVGGQFMVGRSHSSPDAIDIIPNRPGPIVIRRQSVTGKITAVAPQVSFNFGTGNGWSYISGGLGSTVWSTAPDKSKPIAADEASLKTINYGGGARWFAKPRVAFTFDVRFYAINPGIANDGLGISPRTTMLVIGAGVSLR